MPNRPMTFSPSINDDGTYDVNNGSVSVGRSGGSYESPYQEDEATGQRQYLIEERDLQQDEDYQPDNDAEYVIALTQAYPDLMDALAYARDNKSPEYILDFNNKIDSGDYGNYVPLIEELVEEYRSQSSVAPVEEELTDAENVSQDEIDSAVDYLNSQESGGDEVALSWMEQAVEYKESNPIFSAIAHQTARFHRGEIDQSQAIGELLERYSPAQLKPYYEQLIRD
ncbi:hypothetical protein [Synechococcus sp. KORDI-49]|uniref:hypothetical protein n=1 Tax=Synechococcus sp. KORDI-49 TaxID=585423 RepID=UPI0012ECBA54|nr:hypothetical protein [Synechococcus sp. KORDI-49]